MNLIPAPASLVPASHNRGPRSASGLYFYGYRYYDPVKGRWPSRDPIGELGGVNPYAIIGNDSVNRVDLFGLVGVTANLYYGFSKRQITKPTTKMWEIAEIGVFDVKDPNWQILTSMRNDNIETSGGYKYFVGATSPVLDFYEKSGPPWNRSLKLSGNKDRMGAVQSLWKPQGTIIEGPFSSALGPKGTTVNGQKRCVECIVWIGDIQVEDAQEMMGDAPDFLSAIAVAVPEQLEMPFGIITGLSGLMNKNGWVEAKKIGFSMVICADARRAVGIYNIPESRASVNPPSTLKFLLNAAWVESDPGGKHDFGSFENAGNAAAAGGRIDNWVAWD